MRDIAFAAVFIPALIAVFGRPWLGILLLAWIGYMNPHRFCYGFMWSAPVFAGTVAITILSIFVSPENKSIRWTRETVLILLLVIWTNITLFFCVNESPEPWSEWDRWMKIHLVLLLNLMVMKDRFRINALVWTIALSFAFFGLKGGLFAIATGGSYRVQGPEYSFIEDNNHLALTLNMTLPLLRYLQMNAPARMVRIGLGFLMGLTVLAVLSSYSRAGLLALGAVCVMTWMKSRNKFVFGTAMVVVCIAALTFMPDKWSERMSTISKYKQDGSVNGRFNAWRFAANLAAERPLTGGGFRAFTPEMFRRYAPEPDQFHDAHSIYFEMLGEQGYPGLALFLLIGLCTCLKARKLKKIAEGYPDLKWVTDLMPMVQVAFLAYACGGAFVGLAYFDLPYHFVVIVALTDGLVRERMYAEPEPEPEPEALSAAVPA